MQRSELFRLIAALNHEIDEIKAQFMASIKKMVGTTGAQHLRLENLIESAPALFEKPKTQIFYRIEVGFRKGAGRVEWDDEEKVLKLIDKNFPEDVAATLIKTTRSPIKKAIGNLDVADLKRIGCRVESTGDVVVIKPIDSSVEKIINALLKDATED